MKNELDLSELLEERPVPEGGAADARRIAVRRKHRRQAIVGSFGAVALVALASAAIIKADPFKQEVYVARDAGSTHDTTSTTLATTTSVPADPHQRYVGIEHGDQGAGLPLGTQIKMSGYPNVDEPETYQVQVGDPILYWVKDADGEMLWMDVVTKAPASAEDYTAPVQSRVEAVFDLPDASATKPDSRSMCIGWCAKDNKLATDIVGIYTTDDSGKYTFSYAARVDAKKLTMVEIPTKGVQPYLPYEEPAPTLPSRPELYRAFLGLEQWEREWVRTNEQVYVGGGGATEAGETFWEVRDDKENKSVFLVDSTDGRKATVIIDTLPGSGFTFGKDIYTYKGELGDTMLVYLEQNPESNDPKVIHRAWKWDSSTFGFIEVKANDVDFAPAPPGTTIPTQ